jgi:hypothetical protein
MVKIDQSQSPIPGCGNSASLYVAATVAACAGDVLSPASINHCIGCSCAACCGHDAICLHLLGLWLVCGYKTPHFSKHRVKTLRKGYEAVHAVTCIVVGTR